MTASVALSTLLPQSSTTNAVSTRGKETGRLRPLPMVVASSSNRVGAHWAARGRPTACVRSAEPGGVTISNTSASCGPPEENVPVMVPR